MKKLIIFVLSLIPLAGFAQQEGFKKPDFKAIAEEIQKKNSPFNYDKLMKRYEEQDTSLTPEDYYYLYYGFTQTKGYSGYQSPSVDEEMRNLLKDKNLRENEADKKKLNGLCKTAVKEMPVNLRQLSYLAISYRLIKDSVNYQATNRHIMGIVDAIMSTGDGKSVETAMYVITVSDEYELLDIFGFEFGGKQALVGSCDKLDVKPNRYELDALYFNVSALFDNMKKLFDK